jgi:hypothetical protein
MPKQWTLHSDTVVKIGDDWGGGLEIVLEREPQSSIGNGRVLDVSEIVNPLLWDQTRVFKVSLFLDIEEIPTAALTRMLWQASLRESMVARLLRSHSARKHSAPSDPGLHRKESNPLARRPRKPTVETLP